MNWPIFDRFKCKPEILKLAINHYAIFKGFKIVAGFGKCRENLSLLLAGGPSHF